MLPGLCERDLGDAHAVVAHGRSGAAVNAVHVQAEGGAPDVVPEAHGLPGVGVAQRSAGHILAVHVQGEGLDAGVAVVIRGAAGSVLAVLDLEASDGDGAAVGRELEPCARVFAVGVPGGGTVGVDGAGRIYRIVGLVIVGAGAGRERGVSGWSG